MAFIIFNISLGYCQQFVYMAIGQSPLPKAIALRFQLTAKKRSPGYLDQGFENTSY